MPEGDTVRLTARRQHAALAGKALTGFDIRVPQFATVDLTGQVVRDQLKAIGIDMKIKQVDVSVWFDAFSKGDYQITSAYQERTLDPDNFYSLVIRSGGRPAR